MKVVKFALLALMVVAFAAPAQADPVNIQQFPTGFFVPDETQTYNAPYYRWYNEDWGWTHGAVDPVLPGEDATLYISAWDVDAPSEVDNIYAYDTDTAAWVLLGALIGNNNAWGYTTFVLNSMFYNELTTGLQVWIDIDSTNNFQNWAVTLAKSVLTVNGGTPPPPNPGVPDGGATVALLGAALVGLGALRRKL